jgi:formylglycine-generating enzyme required for sulfatase activity
MKNKTTARIAQRFGLFALLAVIGFFFATCGNGSNSDGSSEIPDDDDEPDGSDKIPIATDYTFGNLEQTAWYVMAVTITAKSGKSDATRTVFYQGTDGTVYAKSTTTPQKTGTYAVTFDVVKDTKTDWEAATGLSAGNLVVIGGGAIIYRMEPIQGGTFTMGSPVSEPGRYDDETPHMVTLTDFNMGKYPVTQAQYEAVMGYNPSSFTTSSTSGGRDNPINRPVENVSWYDAILFCNILSKIEGLRPAYSISGDIDPDKWGAVPTSNDTTWNAVIPEENSNGYRLPTEAQWEYACRAGTTTAFNWGTNTINSTQANYFASNVDANNTGAGINLDRTIEVGKYTLNARGLYDMHGNVQEWCWDWHGGDYASSAQTDPKGVGFGNHRVLRGGSWYTSGRELRSACRNFHDPYYSDNHYGFRLVRP